jgi:hypothetical protein
VTLSTLAAVVLVAGLLAGVSRLADAAHAAARTEAVADLTALAAATGGRAAAARVAASSGAELVGLEEVGDDAVRVSVRRDVLVRDAAARSVRVTVDARRDLAGG